MARFSISSSSPRPRGGRAAGDQILPGEREGSGPSGGPTHEHEQDVRRKCRALPVGLAQPATNTIALDRSANAATHCKACPATTNGGSPEKNERSTLHPGPAIED